MATANLAPSPGREPELLGQTVVVIGGSAGIGLRDGPASPRRGRRRHPRPAAIRAPATRGRRARSAERRGLRRDRSGVARTVLPGAAEADRPRDGHSRPAALRDAWPTWTTTEMRRDLERAPHADARRRPQRRRQGATRGHAAVHGRHRRPAPRPRPGDRLDGHRRDARARSQSGARARAHPRQSDRRRLRRHTPVGGAPRRRSSTRAATSCAPRSPSGASSVRPTSPRSPCT